MAQRSDATGDSPREVRAIALLHELHRRNWRETRTRDQVVAHPVLADWPEEHRHAAIDDLAAAGHIRITSRDGDEVIEFPAPPDLAA